MCLKCEFCVLNTSLGFSLLYIPGHTRTYTSRCDGPGSIHSSCDVQLLGESDHLPPPQLMDELELSNPFLPLLHPRPPLPLPTPLSLPPLHQAKPEDTLDLCKLLNDDLARTISKHPTRFVGLATLPMQAPELAVQELRRCVKVCRIYRIFE